MGSMNFGLYPVDPLREFEHTQEEIIKKSRDLVFKNTFQDIETILKIGKSNETRFEFECYDISHLYNLKHFVDRNLISLHFLFNQSSVCWGGLAHTEKLYMKRAADACSEVIVNGLFSGRVKIR